MAYKKASAIDLDELIKPIDQMPGGDHRTWLISGHPGGGKTTSVRTIAPIAKCLYLDLDGKSSVLKKPELAEWINGVNLKFDLNTYKDQLAVIDALYDLDTAETLAVDHKWLIIDGLTNFYALGCQKAHDTTKGSSRYKMNFDKMDYVDAWVWQRIHRWRAVFENVVLFTHIDVRGDEFGNIHMMPLARKGLSATMPGNFQEIFHAGVDVSGKSIQYQWVTKPEDYCNNTSSIAGLPAVVPNDFALVMDTDWTALDGDVGKAIKQFEVKHGRKVTGWAG